MSIRKSILYSAILLLISAGYTFAQQPASNNYELSEFTFGSGGDSLTGSSYNLFGTLGEVDVSSQASSLYNLGSGLTFSMQANVPPAPTLVNQNNSYNRLRITLETGSNPSDALYAIMISTDSFVSDIKYVQSDQTISSTLGSEDWQTHTSWGGGSGSDIIGLTPDTEYQVRVAARHGDFTQSRWGPSAAASTAQVSISFDIDVSSSDTETAAPYTVSFGDLSIGSVNTATEKIWLDIDTNAENGSYIYIYGENAGLYSTVNAYTISALTGDLSVASEGFGIRNDSATQTTGGPLAPASPYDSAGDTVGTVDTTIRTIYDSTNSPITGGRGSIVLKAKPASTTPSANDYSDILTIVAAGSF